MEFIYKKFNMGTKTIINVIESIKIWVEKSYKIISLGFLFALTVLVVKQQRDINDLKTQVNETKSSLKISIDSTGKTLKNNINNYSKRRGRRERRRRGW